MAENFNITYKHWKQDMVDMVNSRGIPLSVARDFLQSIINEIDRVLVQQEAQQEETESVQSCAEEDVV